MRKCGEGGDQDQGIVYMSAVGSAGAGVGAKEGDGGTITITRGTGGWVWCGCGCGCDCKLLKKRLNGVHSGVLATRNGGELR